MTRGMVITVNKAVYVKVKADGRTMMVQTPKVPVRDVLQAAGIAVGPLTGLASRWRMWSPKEP